jgi:hypothetical protein
MHPLHFYNFPTSTGQAVFLAPIVARIELALIEHLADISIHHMLQ